VQEVISSCGTRLGMQLAQQMPAHLRRDTGTDRASSTTVGSDLSAIDQQVRDLCRKNERLVLQHTAAQVSTT
jgi:hypothetical protein